MNDTLPMPVDKAQEKCEAPLVLVIDGDPQVSIAVRRALEGIEHRLHAAVDGMSGLREAEAECPDLVVIDHSLPDCLGMDVLVRMHQLAPQVPVLFVTASGAGSTAIEAMKLNAFDCLPKPLEPVLLRQQISRALALRSLLIEEVQGEKTPHVASTNASSPPQVVPDALVGECVAMQSVFKAIGKVALQDVPVLLRGEHGTGKEAVAREIHQHSKNANGPFVKLHCPGMSEERLEQELLGSANASNGECMPGLIETTQGGTLLLQEVGHLPLSTQAKLLQIIRKGTYQPAGADDNQKLSCRLMTITSDDLESLVRAGKFRSDLYYALTSFVISLPPLRQRHGDLPLLIAHSLQKFRHIAAGFGVQQSRISDDAMKVLCKHVWPGNIDELESVLKRALVEQKGHILVAADMQHAMAEDPVVVPGDETYDSKYRTDWAAFVQLRIESNTDSLHADAVEETERKLFSRVLAHTAGNQAQAARILGITRSSLRNKLRLYRMNAQQLAN